MPRLPYNTDGSKHQPRDDFETPRDLFKRLKKAFNITLDAAGAGNKHKRRCAVYLTDAFHQPWRAPQSGTIFANPPGSQLRRIKTSPWIQRAVDEAYRNQTVFVLVPAATGARWFKLIWLHAAVLLFFDHRLTYELDGVPQGKASFDSALAGFGLNAHQQDLFRQFGDLGTVLYNWRGK